MRAIVFACIVAAFCVTMSLQYTPHTPCGDGPAPKELRVEGCDKSPCNMIKGTDLIAQWDFVANADAEKLQPRVRIILGGVTLDYPYPQKDACKSLTNSQCPLKKGDEVTYNLKMPISKVYPRVRMTIEFALVDENKNVQVCFKMEGKVIDKKTLLSSIEEDSLISYM